MTAFMVVLWSFIGLSALGLTVMGIFLTHVRAMNAADAAAEAALLSLKEPMIELMTSRSADNLAAFWREVNQEVSHRVDDWEDEYRAARRKELESRIPPLTSDEIYRIIGEEVSERRPKVAKAYRESAVRSRQPNISSLLLSGQPLPLLVQLQYFLTTAEVGCIAQETAEAHRQRMVAWAGAFSEANHGEPPGNRGVEVSSDGRLKVRVLVPYRLHFFVLDAYVDEDHRYLAGEATHELQEVAGLPVRVPGTCPS